MLDWPGPTLLDGNGTTRLYVDDGADTNQQKELEDIFQGRRGGPMQMLSQLVAKWLPTVKTRIDIKEDNGSHNITAKVGNFGEIKSQQLRNEAGRAMTLQGAGFASMFQFENDVLTLAPSDTQWSDSDLPHTQVTTRSGAVGKFSWRSAISIYESFENVSDDWFDVSELYMPCPCEFAQTPTYVDCDGYCNTISKRTLWRYLT